MRATCYENYGGADVLTYGDQPTPAVGKDEVLVRVRAASVNPVDWKIRQGELKLASAFRFPIIPGRDVAGTVAEFGRKVTTFKPGDRVFGMLPGNAGGAYADFAALPADLAVAIPAGVDDVHAAAVPLTGLTALQALRDHSDLQAGERVLVNGASGGVGRMAVQIAKALGAAEVVGVCSAAHFDLVRSLGADRLIDHHAEDITAARDAYDVIFDAVGKRTYGQCKPVLRHDGRYVTTLPDPKQAIGYLTSLVTEKKMRSFMAKDRGQDMALVASGWRLGG